jgi:hypothetical protein
MEKTARNKALKDLDLDVLNLLKDFPKDDKNAVIYVRIECKENDEIDSFLTTRSNRENLSQLILALMENKEDMKVSIYDAVMAFLYLHREDIPTFKGCLKNIELNKNNPYA